MQKFECATLRVQHCLFLVKFLLTRQCSQAMGPPTKIDEYTDIQCIIIILPMVMSHGLYCPSTPNYIQSLEINNRDHKNTLISFEFDFCFCSDCECEKPVI